MKHIKKTLSIILACLLLASCLPLSAMAATIYEYDVIQSKNATIASGNDVIITANYTIDEGVTVTVNGTLTVSGSGHIENNGTLIVNGGLVLTATESSMDTAALYNKGTVTFTSSSSSALGQASYIYNAGTINGMDYLTILGTLYHQVTLFPSWTETYDKSSTYDRKEHTVTFTVKYVLDSLLDSDTAYLSAESYNNTVSSEKTTWVEHGEKLYILITPNEEEDWIDTGRMQLTVNGSLIDASARVDNTRGVFCIIPTNSINNLAVYSYAYKSIVKLFEITLPRTDGYYVTTMDGDIDTCTVEYGTTFSFRVVLSEDYDQSEITVYADAAQLTPDAYGYYDITGPIVDDAVTTEGGVQDSFTIRVLGVASNSARETVNSVLTFIQEIFAIIQSIFEYFSDLFSGLFS
ncbi:MAG: hypothetical protein LUG85_01175 [Clostridiales bacterium]|nr:hypothetical protein [Clostridiales bacterium]